MAQFIGSHATMMEQPQFRVWIGFGGHTDFYAATSPTDAADILENEGLGSMMAGLEELESDGYHEWYDEHGCDIDEWIESHGDQRRDAEDAEAEYEMTRTLHDEQMQKYGAGPAPEED